METSLANLKRLLVKRGYKIGKYIENVLNFTTTDGKSGKAIWSNEDKEGKKYITDVFAEIIDKPQDYHMILIYNNITNPALKIFNDHFTTFFDCEIFDIKFLNIYIFDHPLVPDTKILNVEEANRVVKEYGGDPTILPYILSTDPVAKCLNVKPGQIVEETSYYDHSLRKIDKSRVPIITYRLCIKPPLL